MTFKVKNRITTKHCHFNKGINENLIGLLKLIKNNNIRQYNTNMLYGRNKNKQCNYFN